MTRETKIGLLVGLAFIIVIGILLADYGVRANQPPQAAVGNTGERVRRGLDTPGGARGGDPGGPLVVPDVRPRPIVTPGDEPRPRQGGTTDVRLPGPGTSRVIRMGGDQDPPPSGDNTGRQVPLPPDDRGPGPVRPDNNDNRGTGGDTRSLPPIKEIQAERGDTVSRWAVKYLGANSKANRDAIISANDSLKTHPNKVVPGETYKIPVNLSNLTPPTSGTGAGTGIVDPPPPPPAREIAYTTKPGDNLWKIAVEQCGNGSLAAKIKELNKDVLKGSDIIHPNIALKLPAKGSN